MALSLSVARRNAAVDATVDALDGASAGLLKVYSGTRPANPDTAPTASEVVLADFTLPNPAFGAAASGSAALNSVTSVSASATGTATWFRATNSAGTAVFDGNVGTSGSDLNLNSTSISTGVTVSISSGSVSMA